MAPAPNRVRRVDPELEQRWDALATASGASAFARPGWVRAWSSAFRGTTAMTAVAVERDGQLAGIMPVLAGRRVLGAPSNSETALFAPVVADADGAERLADALLAGRHPVVDLSPLPRADADALVAAAARHGVPTLLRSVRTSPYVDVGGDPDAFDRRLSKNRRHGLKRLRKRLQETGTVTFEVHDGRDDDLAALLDEGFALEARPWKRAAGTAILSQPRTTRFYTDVARWAADEGILRLAFLRVDGRAIGFGYNLQQGSTLSFMKIGLDDELARFGPGVLLTQDLIRHALAQPEVTVLDFLGENEPFKMDFASGVGEQVRLQLFADRRLGRLEREATARAGRAASRAAATLRERLPAPVVSRLAVLRGRLGR